MTLLLAIALAAYTPTQAETLSPPIGSIAPVREQARIRDRWLRDRLDTIVPHLMREQGIDMWVLVAREYFEEPALATMLDAESFSARRRTIIVFHDPGRGRPVERLTVSRYGLGGLFAPAWDPAKEPYQWRAFARIVAERNPKRIAINSSPRFAFADGTTLSAWEAMTAALAPEHRARVERNEALAIGWLERRTAAEMAAYPGIVRLAHAIIGEAFARVRPGVSTSDDIVWWMRQRVTDLGLTSWFQPSIGILRRDETKMLEGDTVIRRGDMLWTDFGITHLGLNTDTQHLAYVLRANERDAPAGLKAGLAAANRVQDHLTAAFRAGDTGNAILARARAAAIADGLTPSIYTHPIGHHGHGAGASIGYWDNQGPSPTGDWPVRAGTAWSIELNARAKVPEWGGQEVEFRAEEDAYFDGRAVRYLDGRQTSFHLIR